MNKGKFLTLSGIILLLTISFVACSKPPVSELPTTTDESLPVSPARPEEPEERPIYISSIAYEVKHRILLGDLEDFLKKYPIKQVEEEWTQEFHFGRGGNVYMGSRIPADYVYQAKVHIENANSLLTKGKLSTEIESRPLDKNEVAKELEEAKSLLMEQRSSSSTWEEKDIEWAKQSDVSEINNEQTILDIIETYDDYRQKLSEMITTLDRILADLLKAIEG